MSGRIVNKREAMERLGGFKSYEAFAEFLKKPGAPSPVHGRNYYDFAALEKWLDSMSEVRKPEEKKDYLKIAQERLLQLGNAQNEISSH